MTRPNIVTGWEKLSIIIGQLSLAAFGAHALATRQMEPWIGIAITVGIVALAVVGRHGIAGARVLVGGVRAWRGPAPRAAEAEVRFDSPIPYDVQGGQPTAPDPTWEPGPPVPPPRARRTQDEDGKSPPLDWRNFPGGPPR